MALLSEEARKTFFVEHDLAGLLRGDLGARYEAYRTGRDGGWLSHRAALRRPDRLRWSDYDGESISLKQSKTKEPVSVHCSEALRLMLDSAPKVSPFILTREDGRPWFTEGSDKELSKRWRARMAEAGFYAKPFEELSKAGKAEQLHFNDLRGTAVTLLAAAGVAISQICAVTGHTLQSATRILEKYMARTAALSKAAILAFENSPATAFANRLQTGPNPLPEQEEKARVNQ